MGSERLEFLTPKECAILLVRLIELRDQGSVATTRVRLSELTLRRLWGRHRLDRDLVEEIQEWLFRGGWTLFFAGTTYAAVRTSSVMNWPRLSSKKLLQDLGIDDFAAINSDAFDFEQHSRLVSGSVNASVED